LPLRYTSQRQFLFEVNMFKKLLFLLLIISSANAQNTNTNVATPSRTSANTVAKPTPKPKRTPSPRSDGDSDIYGSPEMKPPIPANTTIRGRVYYEDTGRAVKRASVMLMAKDFGPSGREFVGITDSNGNFQMNNVKAGTYYAMVNAPGVVSPFAYADVSQARGEDGLQNAYKNFEPITVNGINDIDVQVPAKRGGAISGRIMYSDGDAAIGVRVQILRKSDGKFIPVISNFSSLMMAMTQSAGTYQTDDRGVYRFAGLPEGEYIVKVSENASHSENKNQSGYGGFESTIFGGNSSFLTMFYPDVFDSEKAQIINLALGQETTEINLTIPDRELHKIEGKIIAGKDKLPIKNAKITLKRVGDNTFGMFENSRFNQNSTTDDEGKFAFKEIPAGTYQATIIATNSSFDEKKQIYGSSSYDEYGAPVANRAIYAANSVAAQAALASQKKIPKFAKKTKEIKIETKDIDELTIELGFGATISGIVKVENGEEMPIAFQAYVMDENDDLSASGGVYSYGDKPKNRTNSPILFDIEGVPEGKSNFRFSADDKNFYVKSAFIKSVDLLGNSFEVKEGEFVKGLEVVLSKELGTLKGKITAENIDSVKAIELIFVPTDVAKRKSDNFTRFALSNENGEFEVKLPPFEYAAIILEHSKTKLGKDLRKFVEENIKEAQKVSIEVNKTQTISIKMKKV
jgi:hypothetical protein